MRSLHPMTLAIKMAQEALTKNEIPVGCVITDADGAIIARAHNETNGNPLHHAEILAIERALATKPRLDQHHLYVTLEPCAMCAGAIALSRIGVLYYGAPDPKMGAVHNTINFFDQKGCQHRPQVFGGIHEQEPHFV